MKILFVSKSRSGALSPIISKQAQSLTKLGLMVDNFIITGKGFWSYIRAINKLTKCRNQYDIIHVHFSYSSIPVLLSRTHPFIISFMGSDLNRSRFNLLFSKFVSLSASQSIVKSKAMHQQLGQDSSVIPNGVDTQLFCPKDLIAAKNKLGWDLSKKHILFAANPSRPEKNFELAKSAFGLVKMSNPKAELHSLIDVDYNMMPTWLNAADVILLTSKYEGSPNVVKEAMACNRPIVCTNVGDVENYKQVPGFFLAEDNAEDIGEKIILASNLKSAESRDYVVENLSQEIISKKLVDIYSKLR